jgi:hypothetical protein
VPLYHSTSLYQGAFVPFYVALYLSGLGFRLYVATSLRHYVTTSLRHYVTTSLRHYDPARASALYIEYDNKRHQH